MAKKAAATVEVVCPCCQAKLKIDPQLAVVLAHEAPPRATPDVDLTDTARILQQEAERREEKFRASVEAEKKKADVLDRLFEEGLKKAQEQPPEKPLRDFDLE